MRYFENRITRTAYPTQAHVALNREGNPKGFAHVDFTNTAEAEKVLKHYQHHAIHVLGQEVRLDRSTVAETAYPPSPRLYFTGWEGNASSLQNHFGALRSKIVDVHMCKPTFTLAPNVVADISSKSQAPMAISAVDLVLSNSATWKPRRKLSCASTLRD